MRFVRLYVAPVLLTILSTYDVENKYLHRTYNTKLNTRIVIKSHF